MSPRNKLLGLIALGLAVFLMTLPVAAQDKNAFIQFYQDHISAADGARCTMFPSCSAYAARAVEKHGPVLGWIMACDRLVRCGRDEVAVSPRIRIRNNEYVSDQVSANDFWWFEKPNESKAASE